MKNYGCIWKRFEVYDEDWLTFLVDAVTKELQRRIDLIVMAGQEDEENKYLRDRIVWREINELIEEIVVRMKLIVMINFVRTSAHNIKLKHVSQKYS